MATMKTLAGKSRSRYKESNRKEANQTRDGLKLIKRLEQRKAWRIQKYKNTPQAELSRTTISLFKVWGIPLLGARTTVKVIVPTVHKRWGRKQ